MTEEQQATAEPKTSYKVKNIKYGEKTVRGRVVGRNKTVIPEEEFEKLAELHCTWQEISDWYSVPVSTLRDNFADLYQKGTTKTKQRLRQTQLKMALNGDRTLLIFLGKNILGQSDQPINKDSTQVLPWLDEATDQS